MSICTIPGCGRAARSLGLCDAHWKRQSKGQPMDAPIAHKGWRAVATTIENATFLAGEGTAETIARRLGYRSKDNLYRVLHRAGRDDVWNAIRRAA